MALLAPVKLTRPQQKSSHLRRNWTRHLPSLLLLFLVLSTGMLGPETARAQSDGNREYQIKAAFLFNFVQFVRWPETAFPSSDAPFYVGVLGDDPFGSVLDDTVQGETINGHRLMVIRSPRIEELKDCQMIFVCRSEGSRVDAILSQLNSRPILTVSEIENFADKGGDINFYLSSDKVRFEINPRAARQCGLKISSQLLSLGKIVEP